MHLKNTTYLNYKMCQVCMRLRKYSRDVLPLSEVKLIKNNTNNADSKLEINSEKSRHTTSQEFRVNDVNIQMISKNIYDQLFSNSPRSVDEKIIKSCQDHLLHHGIDFNNFTRLPDIQLKLPKLEGSNIEEHFYNIGEKQCAPYRNLLQQLASNKIPQPPQVWSKNPGWTKYTAEGPQSVPCPQDDGLIFDVEVLMSAGKRPTLASAVSSVAWYSWVSEPLASDKSHEYFTEVNYSDLIPMETDGLEPCGDLKRPRIIVGHNVSYDRAKIKEQYWLDKTGVRFMDTMSMHTCVSGVTSYQRTVLKTKNREPDPADDDWIGISSLNSLTEVHKLYCGVALDKERRDVFVEGRLEDVSRHFQALMSYCAADVIATHNVLAQLLPLFLERFPHPVTLAGMLHLGSAYLPVNSNWTQYIDSADTVFHDYKLETQQLLTQKADEACRLMEGDAYKRDLWMWDQDWSTQTLKLKKSRGKTTNIYESCDSVPKHKETNEKFDVLSSDYIESLEKCEEVKEVKEQSEDFTSKFKYLFDLKAMLPVKRPYLAGYPAWYRKLCSKPGRDADWVPGANNVTTSTQITPKLLRLTWEGYPLHHIAGEGWGFLVPFSRVRGDVPEGEAPLPLESLLHTCPLATCKEAVLNADAHVLPKTVEEDLSRRAYFARKAKEERAAANRYHGLGVWTGLELQGCCHFLRLPHKDGPKYKVGSPLARDFLNMFSQNVLSAQGNDAEKVLSFGRTMSYWRNNRERVTGQQVVWLPPEALPPQLRGARVGAIVPQVVVCGTLTRRASEPTWMTASNAQRERIGSELRAMVQAPRGFRLVGADVDSQELWVAALLGDGGAGLCGASAFAWAVLAGDKRARTDLHSLTARAARVQRDHAKVINYARIYGAGQNFAERLLKQFNPTMTGAEARSKARKMFTSTKGRRVYTLPERYSAGLLDRDDGQNVEMSGYEAARLAKLSGKRLDEMFGRPKWVGGTESLMFNKLEEIADSEAPRTAFLGGRLSRALESVGGKWGATRLNWVVQSAAADFLHLMLVSMAHLAPEARFCLSFHDEVRYMVAEKHQYETALALQITNLFTRAFCSQRVGIKDLPMSVAFFSSVEVDRVLRKDSNDSCVTPSNPHGLEKGYGIPNGESLTIFDILQKCKINE